MVAYDARVPVGSDRIENRGPLASAVRNSAKPGRTGPEAWVLQASADWSRSHLEDEPATVEAAVLAAFADTIGADMPAVVTTSAHRWRYALVEETCGAPCLYDPGRRLGYAGDGCLGPRIEAAHDSGLALADRLIADFA